MKKGVIFDLDGTLWDASEGMAASYVSYVKEFFPEWYEKGFSVTAEKIRSVCGRPMDEVGNAVFEMIPAKSRKRILVEIWDYEVNYLNEHGKVHVYDGVRPMFEELLARGYKLYIVSNCQSGYIETFLKWSGCTDLISDIECTGGTGLTKAENIKLLASRNGLDSALYIGDTQGDLDSADEAGIPFIYVVYGFGNVDRETAAAEAVGDIPDAVDRLL